MRRKERKMQRNDLMSSSHISHFISICDECDIAPAFKEHIYIYTLGKGWCPDPKTRKSNELLRFYNTSPSGSP